jgi:DNA-directed RNA polymerase subunit M/transcription elongation factor TFIIS
MKQAGFLSLKSLAFFLKRFKKLVFIIVIITMFCDKCGKILRIEKGIGKCSCGFEKQTEITTDQKIKQKQEKGKGCVEDKNELATFPHTCKKCGYDKAQVIEMGVWFTDEGGVVRYKCGKCGFAEQDRDSNT